MSLEVGLNPNFEISEEPVANAAAGIRGNSRFVIYNPAWMNHLDERTGTDWSSVSVLAHEVGHHLNGHTLQRGGSRPPNELEADHFSGFVMQRLGATKQESTAAMRLIASDSGSITHPPKADRVAAIEGGWERSCSADPACDTSGSTARAHQLATEGEQLYQSGQMKLSISKFRAAAGLNNDHAQSRLGDIYRDQGNVSNARRYYFKAAGNNNEHAIASLGEIHFKAGEIELAEQWFERVPRNGHAVSRLGDIHRRDGKITAACAKYATAAELGVEHARKSRIELRCP